MRTAEKREETGRGTTCLSSTDSKGVHCQYDNKYFAHLVESAMLESATLFQNNCVMRQSAKGNQEVSVRTNKTRLRGICAKRKSSRIKLCAVFVRFQAFLLTCNLKL